MNGIIVDTLTCSPCIWCPRTSIFRVICVCDLQASYEWSWSSAISSAAADVSAWHEAWHHQNPSRLQVINVDCSLQFRLQMHQW